MIALERIVEALLSIPRAAFDSIDAFVAALDRMRFEGSSIDQAALGGAMADRLGYAFVGGYHAAMSRLARSKDRNRMCLAATEPGGVHPRSIETELGVSNGVPLLSGKKSFVTLASVSHSIVVIARKADVPGDRPELLAIKVPRERRGITLVARPETPFAPEVPHAEVSFEDVVIDPSDILPGDGYADYLRPFRTLEDLHVLAAGAGYLLSVARASAGATRLVPRCVALLSATRALGQDDARSPAVHLALAPLFDEARSLVGDVIAALDAASDERARLERDRPLFMVAESARQKRLEAARRSLGLPLGDPSAK